MATRLLRHHTRIHLLTGDLPTFQRPWVDAALELLGDQTDNDWWRFIAALGFLCLVGALVSDAGIHVTQVEVSGTDRVFRIRMAHRPVRVILDPGGWVLKDGP